MHSAECTVPNAQCPMRKQPIFRGVLHLRLGIEHSALSIDAFFNTLLKPDTTYRLPNVQVANRCKEEAASQPEGLTRVTLVREEECSVVGRALQAIDHQHVPVGF
jgi:hypothetical protein